MKNRRLLLLIIIERLCRIGEKAAAAAAAASKSAILAITLILDMDHNDKDNGRLSRKAEWRIIMIFCHVMLGNGDRCSRSSVI